MREKVGAAGRAVVAEKHDIRKLNVELVALYRDISGCRPS
jgi:hypothetical protein